LSKLSNLNLSLFNKVDSFYQQRVIRQVELKAILFLSDSMKGISMNSGFLPYAHSQRGLKKRVPKSLARKFRSFLEVL
jgi:hypothetical protein